MSTLMSNRQVKRSKEICIYYSIYDCPWLQLPGAFLLNLGWHNILPIERCSILMFSSCAHEYIDKDNNLKVAIDLIQKHFGGDLPIKQFERT